MFEKPYFGKICCFHRSEPEYSTLLLLVSVVQSRLPTDILIEIGKGMKLEDGEDWNLETLMKLLKVEIETRECVQTKVSNRGTFSVENKRPNYGKSNPPTAAALYTSESPGNTPDCTYCRGKHPSADCHVVTNLQERKTF